MTAIAIDSLSFRYPNRDTLVLEDFNLCIEEQEVVAVIGVQWCGGRLLGRFWREYMTSGVGGGVWEGFGGST